MVSQRIQRLSESMTMAITALAKELQAQGRDVLSFSAGEPDFDTPQPIKDAAIKAIEEGFTKYTPVEGIPELRQAISQKFKRENGLNYEPDQIIVSNGAKQSLFNLFQTLIDQGDEVIIPAPYWVTYPELVKYSGGTPVIIPTTQEQGFKITPQQLEEAITPRTKMLILTSPSNPTGAIYSKEELEGLAQVLEGREIFVCSDEIYEKLVYEGRFVSAASISEDMYQRTFTINGLSKSAAMTGWRFGYLAAPNTHYVQAMKKLQSQSTSNVNSITQKAAIPGLDGTIEPEIERMRLEFQRRRDEAVALLNQIDGLKVLSPAGAFYLFVNHEAIEPDSMVFAKQLLEREGVAIVPGAAFGSDGHFRFSFATDMATIRTGIQRIRRFVESI
ncbi:MAG: pyridoxal phosphate-dependent aminotransferase [Nitratiruptor sp.]|nr:pyridoxal phosphate-dependent aminotransferase [Nitratiruptor sp.]NPA84110.1 pyridoxal phosphate-dependent aminotransferase [Campylobacterota bacterium]